MSALFKWSYDSPTVVFAPDLNPVESEEGFRILPERTLEEFRAEDYDALILPGCSDFRESIGDERLFSFLRSLKGQEGLVIGAICAGPLYLAKAGLLDDRKFTASLFMEMYERFPFIRQENLCFQPVVVDGRIVTAVGEAFQQFAVAVARRVGHECRDTAYTGILTDWKPEDFQHHLSPEGILEFEEAFAEWITP